MVDETPADADENAPLQSYVDQRMAAINADLEKAFRRLSSLWVSGGRALYYTLNSNGEPAVCDDQIEWMRWFRSADRHVAYELIGRVRVSTVFLAIDHAYGNGPPILWETMIFGGYYDVSRAAAARGHEKAAFHVRRFKSKSLAHIHKMIREYPRLADLSASAE